MFWFMLFEHVMFWVAVCLVLIETVMFWFMLFDHVMFWAAVCLVFD